MNHLENYQVFEARYKKKRNLIGKISDFLYGRKSYRDIIENIGENCRKPFTSMNIYKWVNNEKITDNCFQKEINIESHYGNALATNSNVLAYKRENPDTFPIFGLFRYKCLRNNGYKKIKLEILINDILNIIKNKLDIISISITNINEDHVEVTMREIGWQKGDGMPIDVLEHYSKLIEDNLKKKVKQYIKEYNILQSQKTSQEFKYRSINLYSVSISSKLLWDREDGFIKISICPTI